MIIVTVNLDEVTYTNLIQILEQKFYETTELSEMAKINDIYKALKWKSETWLTTMSKNIGEKK